MSIVSPLTAAQKVRMRKAKREGDAATAPAAAPTTPSKNDNAMSDKPEESSAKASEPTPKENTNKKDTKKDKKAKKNVPKGPVVKYDLNEAVSKSVNQNFRVNAELLVVSRATLKKSTEAIARNMEMAGYNKDLMKLMMDQSTQNSLMIQAIAKKLEVDVAPMIRTINKNNETINKLMSTEQSVYDKALNSSKPDNLVSTIRKAKNDVTAEQKAQAAPAAPATPAPAAKVEAAKTETPVKAASDKPESIAKRLRVTEGKKDADKMVQMKPKATPKATPKAAPKAKKAVIDV